MSYKKVGGLHFVRIGRLGFSFFLARKPSPRQMIDNGIRQLVLNLRR
jgi:hypothetical protein